jgi:hypothetical protein
MEAIQRSAKTNVHSVEEQETILDKLQSNKRSMGVGNDTRTASGARNSKVAENG